MSTAISNETAIALAGAPKLTNESARLRELEEREISALASHAEQGSDPRFFDLFCFECDDNRCEQGTARDVAQKVYGLGWVVYANNPLCRECQSR